MLSKGQARAFFVVGTTVFSLVFLWLTIDTMNKVAAQSDEQAMDESVTRGKRIWEDNNCMGCHTILGEGAYYAPELTKAYERRGEAWLRLFLKDPEAMFPGQRRMVNYHFDEAEIGDVIAFLRWIGGISTNGFPAEPDLVVSAAPVPTPSATAAATATTKPTIVDQICLACHSLGGRGQKIAPAFDGIANRYDPAKLDVWLRDPQAVKPGTLMPNLSLDDRTRSDLVAWLMTLQ